MEIIHGDGDIYNEKLLLHGDRYNVNWMKECLDILSIGDRGLVVGCVNCSAMQPEVSKKKVNIVN